MRLQVSTRSVLVESAILAVLIVAALADALPIGAQPRWLLLTIHVLCTCLLVGTASSGALALALADISGDAAARAFVSRGTTIADAVFTVPASMGLVVTGTGLCSAYGGPSHLPWVQAALVVLGVAGLGWLCVLVPLQEQLHRAAVAGDVRRWERIARVYPIPGIATGALLLLVLGLMVAKPPL